MADKAIQNNGSGKRTTSGTLITGGFRLIDADGRVIKEGHLPNSPRVEVPVEFTEVDL